MINLIKKFVTKNKRNENVSKSFDDDAEINLVGQSVLVHQSLVKLFIMLSSAVGVENFDHLVEFKQNRFWQTSEINDCFKLIKLGIPLTWSTRQVLSDEPTFTVAKLGYIRVPRAKTVHLLLNKNTQAVLTGIW